VKRGCWPALLLVASGCAHPEADPAPYRPSWRDYAAFAAAWPDLLEPNYLPFMLHRAAGDDGRGDLLFFCRWDAADMPLRVHVGPVAIPDALQDEFSPREPAQYDRAVKAAFATWERELEGLVSFRLVERASEADVAVQLHAARAPEPDASRRVLGSTPLAGACRVFGLDPDAERLRVSFRAPELRLYLADEFGLLSPDQVEWVALHEIGHVLGMRGHSPIPADLMYEVARDRMLVGEGLSAEDVNSFVSLYQIENGALFGRVDPGPAREAPVDPGLPALAMAPYVDARLGFEFRPPAGWLRVPTARGMAAVHGTTWDYAASLQVIVERYPTIADYLDRYGAHYRERGSLSPPAPLVVNGRRAIQTEIAVRGEPRVEQLTLVEVGDGRLLVIVADSSRESFDAYRPWFAAALGTLEITDLPGEAWPRTGGRR
jgi:predicted Zn-dependent protease